MSRLMTKPTKWPLRPESSMSAWRNLGSLPTHCAHSKDSDQTGRMPRLIWVFAGRRDHFVGFVMRWIKYGCNYSRIWTIWLCHRVMHPKDVEDIANSQSAASGAVWSGFIMCFARPVNWQYQGSLRCLMKSALFCLSWHSSFTEV